MNFLAIDIGASSGRHIVDSGGELTEVYRFETGFKQSGGRLVCDVEALFSDVLEGVRRAFAQFGGIRSLAVDTWGVDYVLMRGDEAIMPCYAYRDVHAGDVVTDVHAIIPFDELYARTGIQFQPFNTIYRLYADRLSGRLEEATDFLMLPEYLNYLLTGVKLKEYTNATTTGLVNAATGCFDGEICGRLGLPQRLFPPLCQPGTAVGKLKPEIARSVGGHTEVVLCASHDTASAVEGIPMSDDCPYISSGTWSLLGVKTDKALTGEASRKANFSNEGGVGYNRYQKNIMGMWVVLQLQRELCPQTPVSEIVAQAMTSDYIHTADVNDAAFLSPVSMKRAFDDSLLARGRPLPAQAKDYFNCAFLSLAESYRDALRELEANTLKRCAAVYIVGGGAKNGYLNKLTADACQTEVRALPIEATAIGNLKLQKERANGQI